jgi:uncharacterized metal-binding protein YceD (DUF177 family)
MKRSLREYDIAFTGLKLGEHRFDYQLDNKFFTLFEYDEFLSADLHAEVGMVKKESSLEFQFTIDGTVNVPCDITTEPFDLPLHHEMDLVVKFGQAYDDSKDEILIIPSGEHKMNIAQYLYELSVLALPLKRLSEKGKELQLKEEMNSDKSENKDEGGETDPRWDKLKDLLN